MRVKWIALFSLLGVLLSLLGGGLGTQLTIAVSLSNYLLFFAASWVRHWRDHGKVAVRQQKFQLARHNADEDETLHRCKVCSRTEVDAADLDFRVSDDGEEYCLAHLPSRQAQVPPPLPQVEEHSG